MSNQLPPWTEDDYYLWRAHEDRITGQIEACDSAIGFWIYRLVAFFHRDWALRQVGRACFALTIDPYTVNARRFLVSVQDIQL